tara:strand:- start:857 stop:1696 length:840 start_codon:yes stop_codon:yes gene_type:complete
MLIYPTIKQSPFSGLSGMGGGCTGMSLAGGNPPGFQTHDCMPILQTNPTGSVATDAANSVCNDDAHAAHLKVAIPGVASIGQGNHPEDVHDHVPNASGSPITIDSNGNTVSGSTTQSKFYGKSWYFPDTESGSDWQAWMTNVLKDIGTGDYTVECWIYRVSGTLLFDGNQDASIYIYTYGSEGNLDFYTNNSCQTSGGAVGTNAWHHVAFVRHGSNKYIYVNGTRTNTCQETSFGMSGDTNMAIGSRNNGSDDWKGYMNDIRMYHTAKYTGNSFTIFPN